MKTMRANRAPESNRAVLLSEHGPVNLAVNRRQIILLEGDLDTTVVGLADVVTRRHHQIGLTEPTDVHG